MLLALVFLECPLDFAPLALALALSLTPPRTALEEDPLEVVAPPPKKLFDASVGETGEVSGVLIPVLELAIVPPTPTLLVGDMSLVGGGVYLPIMEQLVGVTVVMGLSMAGLWGDGMPIMKGMLPLEPLLNLRWGEEVPPRAAVLELSEPARGRRRRGAGIADIEPEVPGRESWLFERPRMSAAEESDSLRGK